ncbi:MAG: hypothetical protein LN413_07930 [Candidatus Thermoplasmatota archaeon]|nr:hypothetical protein [Candidatus Thermoplasmatota archaeon]
MGPQALALVSRAGSDHPCNADTSRFNLVGGTKIVDELILSYVDETGQLAAERVAGNLIEVLDGLLPRDGRGPEEGR